MSVAVATISVSDKVLTIDKLFIKINIVVVGTSSWNTIQKQYTRKRNERFTNRNTSNIFGEKTSIHITCALLNSLVTDYKLAGKWCLINVFSTSGFQYWNNVEVALFLIVQTTSVFRTRKILPRWNDIVWTLKQHWHPLFQVWKTASFQTQSIGLKLKPWCCLNVEILMSFRSKDNVSTLIFIQPFYIQQPYRRRYRTNLYIPSDDLK